MALLDIDRHILMEMANCLNSIKNSVINHDKQWSKIIEVRNKTDVLFRPKDTKGTEKEFVKLRNKIFKSTIAADIEFQIIKANLSKTEALISHLVSYVKEIDTQKGQETKEN